MGCPVGPHQCRAKHIAPKLRDVVPDSGDFEARCPVCGHKTFRISAPKQARYRHIWTCACKRCKCSASQLRAAQLAAGIAPGCLGSYGASSKTPADPAVMAMLVQAVDDILSAPRLKPSDIRIILAEAKGQKVPTDPKAFVPWAISIGIGRRQAYEARDRWCRPAD
jgi:hypothetical protein